jgi:predicted extracellular nuclease
MFIASSAALSMTLTPAAGKTAPSHAQGRGSLADSGARITPIHEVQGTGDSTPIVPGTPITVEAIVIGSYQGRDELRGFFLQEDTAHADSDARSSEGLFVSCGSCSTRVVEGQRVRATGTIAELFTMTAMNATRAGAIVVVDRGNQLAHVTRTSIDLPVNGNIDAFYEAREGMLVRFVDTLTVADLGTLPRFGQVVLFEGERPHAFTDTSPPRTAGYAAHLESLARRRVILDDRDNVQNRYLSQPDRRQAVFYPRANGGFSAGVQGPDFFRSGDLVAGLTGVLHRSFAGVQGTDAWRIRPTNTAPVGFRAANPRPTQPPDVGGAIRAASVNLLNYFTTIDTTPTNATGTCGPARDEDCRGADSAAELARQRHRAALVICRLNADVTAFMELENTTPAETMTDLLGAVNARCGGVHPYAAVKTEGTVGADTIRVHLIYRTGVLSAVGSPLIDRDAVHSRPPIAQTLEVVHRANAAFGRRFTVIANHFKSKGCDADAMGDDADRGDGQSCYNAQRVAQARRLLAWIAGTVAPAAASPDVLLLGDFNAYAHEDPIAMLRAGGFTDLASTLLGSPGYSYVFDGQIGHLDYAFASARLGRDVAGIGIWHINADESDLFDYNDTIRDAGEAAFERKPDGSALGPRRSLYERDAPYRASDHDPVVVGIFGGT